MDTPGVEWMTSLELVASAMVWPQAGCVDQKAKLALAAWACYEQRAA